MSFDINSMPQFKPKVESTMLGKGGGGGGTGYFRMHKGEEEEIVLKSEPDKVDLSVISTEIDDLDVDFDFITKIKNAIVMFLKRLLNFLE